MAKKKVQATVRQRAGLIDRGEARLSVRKQCLLIGISRSLLYYQRKPRQPLNEVHHAKVRSIAEAHPYYGYRKVVEA